MYGDLNSLKSINKVIKFAKLNKKKRFKLIYCPPYTLLRSFCTKLQKSPLLVGAQNCHEEVNYGAFTGSINAKMIKNLGAKYIILGHSENRLEGETNRLIKKKIISALNQKLNVIFCIGETFYEKKRNKTFSVLKKQIKSSLKKNFNMNRIIIAYEPVWSIGTNKIPKINELKNIIKFIKNEFKKTFKMNKSP